MDVVIEAGLSGRTVLFWAPPRGRGPMPRSWRRWAFAQDGKHAGRSDGFPELGLVLHCINTYEDGYLASEARQAVGGGRGAVDTGTHLAEATHRLVLWVGGLSTVGANCTLPQSTSAHSGQGGGPATAAATAFTGELRMIQQDKPTPLASLPDNWSAFNDREVLPSPMCRADAAAT